MSFTCLPLRQFAAGAAVLLVGMTAHATPSLECHLSVAAETRLGKPVWLTFELRNTSPAALYVLNWNTPLEGFFGRYLTVRGPDGEVAYQGPMVKRGPPEPDEYVRVKAGGSARARVDISLVYEIRKPGRYEATFAGRLHDVSDARVTHSRGMDQLKPLPLSCPAVQWQVLPD